MSAERLAWIYAAEDAIDLQRRYDEWSRHYDEDMAELEWAAPAAAAAQCLAHGGRGGVVLDAGCGTGQVGMALRAGGAERVIGVDFSAGMLGKAALTGAYDELLQASLTETLPLMPGSLDAVVSVGVFTFGHVGPSPLADLGQLLRPGGTITLSFRDDAFRDLGFSETVDHLVQRDGWRLTQVTEPRPLVHEGAEGVLMRVWTWTVRQCRGRL